ncbi:hypothetical protein AVEN_62268-1 [Araneus ventricosus]|uniref:Uncharacterized protein n=1 Tax=Araneus ventricosus TaxID=182803 RepID=A0A4Y2EB24_ARAVE|nr:hypothetical protein AVEN_62268-1 [Araneus ventricosus]
MPRGSSEFRLIPTLIPQAIVRLGIEVWIVQDELSIGGNRLRHFPLFFITLQKKNGGVEHGVTHHQPPAKFSREEWEGIPVKISRRSMNSKREGVMREVAGNRLLHLFEKFFGFSLLVTYVMFV